MAQQYQNGWTFQPVSGSGSQFVTAPAMSPRTSNYGVSDLNKAYAAATEANLKRYNDILGGYQNLLQAAGKGMDTTQAVAESNRSYDALQGSALQSMVSRGLTGTTIVPTVAAGIASRKASAGALIKENAANQAYQNKMNVYGQQLGFMERRDDIYPNLNSFAQLLEAARYQTQLQPQKATAKKK